MTAAVRKTPTVANGGSGVGATYTALVDNEVEAIWQCVGTYLTSIGGSANAITAVSDSALVSPVLAYTRPMAFWLVPTSTNTSSVTINIDGVAVVAIVDKDGNGLVAGALTSGRLHHIVYVGSNFRLFSSAPPSNPPTPAPDMIVREQEAQNTNAGAFTTGSWVTRTLNISVRNVISGASLASNQITLPAGTYAVEWSAPANDVGNHQTQLYNVTDSVAITVGTTESAVGAGTQTRSIGISVFTLSTSKAITVQHRCRTTRANDGLGTAANFTTEIYSWVKIWKTA
jgi:hypothetical protein